MEKEIWKEIPTFIGYEVSNMGRVRSLDRTDSIGRKIKGGIRSFSNSNGYLGLVLSKGGKKKFFGAHVLVAMAFLDHVPCGHKLVVDHYPDKTTTNNKLSNLRIDTNRGNLSRIGGSSKYVGVSFHKGAKKWRATIWIDRKIFHLGYFTNEIDAHNAYQKKLKEIS